MDSLKNNALKLEYPGECLEYPDTTNLTWIRTKGSIVKYLYYPSTIAALSNFMNAKPMEVEIIGNGSNTLLGNINHFLISTKKLTNIIYDTDSVTADAGVNNIHLVQACLKHGQCGFEFLYTIPGTIGGAIAMNAGAHGDEIANYILEVECMIDGKFIRLSRNEIDFNYRFSSLLGRSVILRVKLKLDKASPDKILEYTKYVNQKQPRDYTLGSTFKNPPSLQAWALLNTLSEAELSSENAHFSELHRNFIINTGDATASEIYSLIQKVQKLVLDRTGVQLETEVRILGDLDGL